MPDSEVQAITLGDMVRCRNVGTTPVRWQWNLRQFVLNPQVDTFVPFDLMKLMCGDPRSSSLPSVLKEGPDGAQTINSRPSEVRRLMQFYQGSTANGWDPTTQQRVQPFREFIPEMRDCLLDGLVSDLAPTIEVYTLTGDRIFTVLDDPFGDKMILAAPIRRDADFSAETIRRLSDDRLRDRKLMEIMARKLGIDLADLGVDDTPLEKESGGIDAPDSEPQENPRMVFDPLHKTVKARPGKAVADPTTLAQLPEDE
jgi:hypothetical protein